MERKERDQIINGTNTEIDHEATKFECIRHMLNLLPTGNFRIIYRFLQICVECSKCCEVRSHFTILLKNILSYFLEKDEQNDNTQFGYHNVANIDQTKRRNN